MFRIICLAAFAAAVVAFVLIVLFYLKGKSIVVPYIIFFVFIAVFGVMAFLHITGAGEIADDPTSDQAANIDLSEEPSPEDSPHPHPSESHLPAGTANIVFDAQRFMFIDSTTGSYLTVSEKELLDMIGTPDNIDEWNYESSGMVYPIRSLSYDNGKYVYEFNNDHLMRIQIFEQIPYNEKSELLELFNLRKESNSKTIDTGTSYRVYDCMVNDLWCTFNSDGSLFSTYISYSNLFG